MSDLSAKFATIEEQLASQAATIEGFIDTVEPKLQSLLDIMDIINTNAAANTKALLAALGQSAACFPCPTPSIVVPSIPSTPIGVDVDKCKRSQAFIAAIAGILTAMDTLQSFNVIGTYNVISDGISQAIHAVLSGETPPLPSFPETVNIVGDYISYAGERAFSGVGLMEQFSPLADDLVSALYLSGSATAAQEAYNATIEGSGVSNGARLLFEAVGFAALYVYFFDPSSEPDLTGFDGLTCAIPSGTCFTFDLEQTHWTNGAALFALTQGFGVFTPEAVINSGGTVTSDIPCFFNGNPHDWTVHLESGSADYFYRAGNLASGDTLTNVTIPGHADPPMRLATAGAFFFAGTSSPIIRLCYEPL